MCDMAHSYVWHDSFICVTSLTRICDEPPHSHVYNMTHSYGTWLIHMGRMNDITHSYLWRAAFTRVQHDSRALLRVYRALLSVYVSRTATTWYKHPSWVCIGLFIRLFWEYIGLFWVCVWVAPQQLDIDTRAAFTRVQHDSFILATWLIYVCTVTHSCVQRDSFTYATWLIQMCGLTHSYVWHDVTHAWHDSCNRQNNYMYIQMSHVPYRWVMSHIYESCPIWMSHVPYEWIMSHMNESCPIRVSHVTIRCKPQKHTQPICIWDGYS